MRGQIIKLISNQYEVLLANGETVSTIAMGKLRLGDGILCGDFVEVEKYDGRYAIEKIYPRNNSLERPPIANVDQAFIVMSAVEPDFSTNLVDQLIFLISLRDINPIIVVTKLDLVTEEHYVYRLIDEYCSSGYQVILTGKNIDTKELEQAIADKVTVLAGQSGAGKSTLLNRLDPDFKLATQEISKALGRGKHTTRHVQLHRVKDGWVADTPGFSKLDFSRVDKEELRDSIRDFKPYADQCRFRDCLHESEPHCAVITAVNKELISKTRYYHYLNCLKVIDEEGKKHYE